MNCRATLGLALLLVAFFCAPNFAAAKKSKAGPWADKYNKLIGRRTRTTSPDFCVVVRTYWGHGGSGDGGLRRLLRSLQRQTVQS
jgi:hypothetical protein